MDMMTGGDTRRGAITTTREIVTEPDILETLTIRPAATEKKPGLLLHQKDHVHPPQSTGCLKDLPFLRLIIAGPTTTAMKGTLHEVMRMITAAKIVIGGLTVTVTMLLEEPIVMIGAMKDEITATRGDLTTMTTVCVLSLPALTTIIGRAHRARTSRKLPHDLLSVLGLPHAPLPPMYLIHRHHHRQTHLHYLLLLTSRFSRNMLRSLSICQ